MKHHDLIIAAMDGKTIQWAYKPESGLRKGWIDFTSEDPAIKAMINQGDDYQFRLKPIPVPEKVWWGVVGSYTTELDARWLVKPRMETMDRMLVKLTIKTDENGVTTEHVEIVK